MSHNDRQPSPSSTPLSIVLLVYREHTDGLAEVAANILLLCASVMYCYCVIVQPGITMCCFPPCTVHVRDPACCKYCLCCLVNAQKTHMRTCWFTTVQERSTSSPGNRVWCARRRCWRLSPMQQVSHTCSHKHMCMYHMHTYASKYTRKYIEVVS